MTMNKALFTSHEAVNQVLASGASDAVLRCRAGALQRLAEDCARFFPWPALHSSLMADAKRCRDAVEAEEPPELERCAYCGGMFENPCDEPPVDTCEQALSRA